MNNLFSTIQLYKNRESDLKINRRLYGNSMLVLTVFFHLSCISALLVYMIVGASRGLLGFALCAAILLYRETLKRKYTAYILKSEEKEWDTDLQNTLLIHDKLNASLAEVVATWILTLVFNSYLPILAVTIWTTLRLVIGYRKYVLK